MTQEHYSSTPNNNGHTFLRGGGEMMQLMRSHEWGQTAIGPPDTWPQSLRITLGIILNAKSPMFLFWGEELLCFYNDSFRPSLGATGKHPDALGRPGKQVWPEVWDTIKPLIDQVRSGGEAIWSEDQLLPIYRNGGIDDVYWTYGYSPVYDESGGIAGVFVSCTETTEKVNIIDRLQISEQRFQNLMREASVGIIVLSGQEMRVDVVNDAYARLIDRRCDELSGKPLFSVIPETEESFRPILDKVRTTGESIYLYNHPYFVYVDGIRKEGFLNLVYQPYKELDGTITGVMVICQDVTEQKKAELALKESEERFQAAVVAVEGILWTNNAIGQMEGEQPGWAALTGQSYDEYQNYGWAMAVHPDDAQPTIDAWNEAVLKRDMFVFEHRVKMHTGSWGLFSIRAVPLLNDQGMVREWVGVHTNITEQREAKRALEESEKRYRTLSTELDQQVQLRTQQLQESVYDLSRSNQNLQQFAYVASHDLQEPLRKIQAFGDLLQRHYADQLGDGVGHLQKMQSAASRMSTLIKDLLTFSQISIQQETTAPVSLTQVVQTALSNLDIAIADAGAQLHIAPLPTVPGDESQLSQLFQNLLSNALKFRQPNTAPVIQVSTNRVAAADLPPSVKPARTVAFYHRIDVTDNGIGFDEKYASRIFQVFQRLHSRSEFAGTGIGLSICEKVAANHGGAIIATSRPNGGATFSVYLPA